MLRSISRRIPWRMRGPLIACRLLLREQFRSNLKRQRRQPLEWRVLSQNGEDGVIARIFEEIGFGSRLFCEFGFTVAECNALLLVRKQNFSGVWIDADPDNCRIARFVSRLFRWRDITVINERVTRDNINCLMSKVALRGNLDLLSIDIDGIDYWIFDAIDQVRPRVLIIEYNAIFGADLSVTIPYDAGFDRFTKNVNGFYFGASLAALERLAQRKGYRLVGTESSGNNAFFIDADIPAPNLATVTSAQCWHPMEYLTSRGWTMEQCFREIKALPLVSV